MRIENPFSNPSVTAGTTSRNRAESAEPSREGGSSKPDDSGDSLSLSPASHLSSLLGSPFRFLSPTDDSINLNSIAASYHRESASLQGRLSDELNRASIDRSEPFGLHVDAQGAVRVDGDHPQAEAIEKIFADDPTLANDFRYVSATGSLVRAAKEHVEFAARWEEDPVSAIDEFAHLFSRGGRQEFVLQVTSDSFEAEFKPRR